MVRAFVDVFPQAVLLSGAGSDLILLGVKGGRMEIDPGRIARALANTPAVRADLQRVDLGTAHEIIGTFLASARTLTEATRGAAPVVDDRPMQEYGVRSMLGFGRGVPAAIVALETVSDWCPQCFVGGESVPPVQELDSYLELLNLAYGASPAEVATATRIAQTEGRFVAGSAYLGTIVPESADLHSILGLSLARRGQLDAAILEFRRALELAPESAGTHWHLGTALASRGEAAAATAHLARAVALDPSNGLAQSDLGSVLAAQGRLDEATVHFERAIELDPGSEHARRGLAFVQQRRGRPSGPPP